MRRIGKAGHGFIGAGGFVIGLIGDIGRMRDLLGDFIGGCGQFLGRGRDGLNVAGCLGCGGCNRTGQLTVHFGRGLHVCRRLFHIGNRCRYGPDQPLDAAFETAGHVEDILTAFLFGICFHLFLAILQLQVFMRLFAEGNNGARHITNFVGAILTFNFTFEVTIGDLGHSTR